MSETTRRCPHTVKGMHGQERWMKPEVGPNSVMYLWLAWLAGDVEAAMSLESLGLSDEHDFLQAAHGLRPELLQDVGEARREADREEEA